MGDLYNEKGNLEQAIEIYEGLIKVIPEQEFEHKNWINISLGDAYYKIGNKEKAKEMYEEVFQSSKSDSKVRYEAKRRLESYQ